MNLEDTRDEVAAALAELSRLFKPHAKLAFLVRNSEVEDGDMLLTDDDPESIIAAIRQLAGGEPEETT